MRASIGRYTIKGTLGEGGMGVVYAGFDDRLRRPVAIKMIKAAVADPAARERLAREARAAASVNHPAICQLYEIGEDGGELFLAMELLEGEPLAMRIARGALALPEAVSITLGYLAGLGALHAQGFVHRDLKPSNIFLTPHGIKLLDFGLTTNVAAAADDTLLRVTVPGTIVGTPQYASPEQLRGESVDPRADLFAAVILYEMLAGRTPFPGHTAMEVFHAILYEQPPVLTGSAAVAAIDRVVHRALGKRAEERYQSADAMAQDLRAASALSDAGSVSSARAVTRLIVLPFRVLRPESRDGLPRLQPGRRPDQLALGIAVARRPLEPRRDALQLGVAGPEGDCQRSRSGRGAGGLAAPCGASNPRLHAAPRGACRDRAVVAHRAGFGRRSLQPPGRSHRAHRRLALAAADDPGTPDAEAGRAVVAAGVRAVPPRERDDARHQPVAVGPRALRELHTAGSALCAGMGGARPHASDGRQVHRARIDRALRAGGNGAQARARAESGSHEGGEHVRLSGGQSGTRRGSDGPARTARACTQRRPGALRRPLPRLPVCGLLQASLAAAEQATRLDPRIQTSVVHTYFMLGDYARVADDSRETVPYMRNLGRFMLGRTEEALRELESVAANLSGLLVVYITALKHAIRGEREAGLASIRQLLDMRDPEGRYYLARQMILLGDQDGGLAILAAAVEDGFFCLPALTRDPWLDSVRGTPQLAAILRRAEARHRQAIINFLSAEGDRVLGVAHPV